MNKKITIIVGVANDCNSDCCYCYMIASRRSKSKMSPEKIPQLVRNSSVGFDRVEFCWHGGEPLLVGIDFYRSILEAQKQLMQENKVRFKNTSKPTEFY